MWECNDLIIKALLQSYIGFCLQLMGFEVKGLMTDTDTVANYTSIPTQLDA